jgi:hypothetical protein
MFSKGENLRKATIRDAPLPEGRRIAGVESPAYRSRPARFPASGGFEDSQV